MNTELMCREILDWLKELGYTEGTRKNFWWNGFNRIINAYKDKGKSNYDEEFTKAIVEKIQQDFLMGLASNEARRTIRKCAELMSNYARHGEFKWYSNTKRRKLQLGAYFHSVLGDYENFTQTQKKWSPSKRDAEITLTGQFLEYLEGYGYGSISEISLETITKYLQVARKRHVFALRSVVAALRNFGDFIKSSDLSPLDLRLIVPSVCDPHRVMPAFTEDEIHKLLAQAKMKHRSGRRDYAMFLLAVSTGMRQSDIIHLKLKDIDWHKSTIAFTQQKTGKPLLLPLEAHVGNALAEYILNERPTTESFEVFVSVNAPFRCISSSAVYVIVIECMKKAGIAHRPWHGFHSFRRYAATSMVKNKVPFDTVAEILGHSQHRTIQSYIRADVFCLRPCAQGLTGIEVQRKELL